MKKEFKFVSASIVGIVCASLMTPSFAASSVRSLGGAGTYAGTTSATQAASATKPATTAARAGSIRVDGSTRVNSGSSLRTPSTRSATAPRLSIGKYLSTHSSVGTGGKLSVDLSTNDTVTNMQGNIESLQTSIENLQTDQDRINVDIEGLREELKDYSEELDVTYNSETGVLIITYDGEELPPIELFNEKVVEEKINEMIKGAIPDVPDAVTYTAGDGVVIGEDNKISANIASGDLINITTDEQGKKSVNANVIVGALTGKLEADKLVTANQTVDYVTGYAIPKPSAGQCNTPSSTCVLSVNNNGDLYWLELVDTEPAPDGE